MAEHLDPKLLETFNGTVPPEWGDYNGHMNEAKYLEVFAQSNDRFMEIIGADAAYIARGASYFTMESHIRHLGEVAVGSRLKVRTLLAATARKTCHLFHYLTAEDQTILAATGEHVLIHVDLNTRKSSAPDPEIVERIADIRDRHATLPRPDALGRGIAVRHGDTPE